MRGYCFDCASEIEVESLVDSCPLCGGENWRAAPKEVGNG